MFARLLCHSTAGCWHRHTCLCGCPITVMPCGGTGTAIHLLSVSLCCLLAPLLTNCCPVAAWAYLFMSAIIRYHPVTVQAHLCTIVSQFGHLALQASLFTQLLCSSAKMWWRGQSRSCICRIPRGDTRLRAGTPIVSQNCYLAVQEHLFGHLQCPPILPCDGACMPVYMPAGSQSHHLEAWAQAVSAPDETYHC